MKKYVAELEKLFNLIIPLAKANNFTDANAGKAHWWTLFAPLLPIIGVFFKAFAPVMRFYYQSPSSRFSWIMLLSGIAAWNIINLKATIAEVDAAIENAEGLIGALNAVAVEVNISAETTGVTQQVGSDFESSARLSMRIKTSELSFLALLVEMDAVAVKK